MPRLNADYDKQHANDAKTPEDGFANLFGDSKKKAAKLTTSVRPRPFRGGNESVAEHRRARFVPAVSQHAFFSSRDERREPACSDCTHSHTPHHTHTQLWIGMTFAESNHKLKKLIRGQDVTVCVDGGSLHHRAIVNFCLAFEYGVFYHATHVVDRANGGTLCALIQR